MQRVTIGTSTVSMTTEADGALVAAGSVAVSAVAHDGTTVTLSAASANTPSAGLHRATVTVLRPTRVFLTWTIDGVQYPDTFDVVSRIYLTPLEARNADDVLSDPARYPASKLEKAIDIAAAELDRITGRSWTRSYVIVKASPDRYGRVVVRPDIQRIGAWSIDGVSQDVANVKILPGTDMVQLPCGGGAVELGAEVGMDEPPVDLVEAFGQRVRFWAQRANMSTPLYSDTINTATGESVPRARPSAQSTGNPDIDAIYKAYAYAAGGGFA
jgi:hypothetical protein